MPLYDATVDCDEEPMEVVVWDRKRDKGVVCTSLMQCTHPRGSLQQCTACFHTNFPLSLSCARQNKNNSALARLQLYVVPL